VSIAAATLLVVLKLGTGIFTGSLGLISAGIESSGDVVAAVLTFFAIRLGGRPADVDHPYGHRRAENLGALGEAAILAGGGVFIVTEAIGQLTGGTESLHARWYVFVVIGVAILIDVSRIVVSLRTARKYRSAALRSNAFHFAGDMAGSVAVLGGLTAVAAGFKAGDAVAALIVACIIFAVAALIVACIIFAAAGRLIYENARVLMDTAPRRRAGSRRAGHYQARRRGRAAPASPARVRRALLRRRGRRGAARAGHRRGPRHRRRGRGRGPRRAARHRRRRSSRAAA
jgi:divalent metal cation (Fe/Co/Zn/Cd) transporter